MKEKQFLLLFIILMGYFVFLNYDYNVKADEYYCGDPEGGYNVDPNGGENVKFVCCISPDRTRAWGGPESSKDAYTGSDWTCTTMTGDISDTSVCHCGCNLVTPSACYKNKTTGEYVWGKHDDDTNYTKITDITSSADCGNFCWKKAGTNGNEYQEGLTSPGTEWTKVGKVGEVTCSENPACYKNGSTYTWGVYDGVSGYTKVTGVSSSADCNNFCWKKSGTTGNEYQESVTSPGTEWTKVGKVGEVTCSEAPACYKNGSTYTWGNYNGVTGYTKVTGVSSSDDCNNFCWKKTGTNGNEYQENITSPGSGWTKVGKAGEVTCSEAPACYKNGSTYTWGVYDGVTGYTKVTGVSSSADCNNFCWKKTGTNGNEYKENVTSPGSGWAKVGKVGSVTCSESPACYKKGSTYTWGNYNGVSGYTKVTGVSSSTDCNNFCWKKTGTNGNEYQESLTSPGTEWTKVGKVGSVTCSESPACYQNGNNYVWGNYDGMTGYNKVNDITAQNDCAPKCFYNSTTDDYKWDILPPSDDYKVVDSIDVETNCVKKEVEACYKNISTGKYVWGKYEKDSAYSLVSGVNQDECHEPITEVPKTDFDVSKIIYIAVAILAVVGIGFILYSYYFKKKD